MWRQPVMRHVGQLYRRAMAGAVRSPAVCLSVLQPSTPTWQTKGSNNGRLWAALGMPQFRCSHMSSIVGRGAYDERCYQHVKGSGVKSLDLVSDGRLLSISWEDGKVSRFHSVWLRHTCFCPTCRLDSGYINMDFDKVPEQSLILSAEDNGDGCLAVRWKEDPGHVGIFPFKFLKAHCYSKESLEEKRKSIRMSFSKDTVIPRFSYDEVANSRKALYHWVRAINETGITVVEGVPCEPGMVIKVLELIADITQHSFYGQTFDVKPQPRAINPAFATGTLKLHMDLPMYESPPGLQALHCIQFDESTTGGENFFVDLFHVAETFREQYPEDFDLLCKVPVPIERLHYNRDWPVHMRHQRPLIAVNKHGELTGITWTPAALGGLQVEEELVEPFYRAVDRMYSLVHNFPHRFDHRLRAGEMITFNNRRVLHGRAAFNSQEGKRFLQGCYVEISEFKSCVQVLSNLEGDGRPAVRVGDYDMQ